MKELINKIVLLCIAVVIAYTMFHVTLLDEVLLVYLGTAILFRWNGGPIVLGGLALLIVTWTVKGSRPDFDILRLAFYQWWLIGVGVALMAWQRVPKHWKEMLSVEWFELSPIERRQRAIAAFRTLGGRMREDYHFIFGRLKRATKIKVVSSITLVIATLFFTNLPVDRTLFLVFFLNALLFRLDSRIPVIGAFLCLLVSAGALLLGEGIVAAVAAEYVYFLLFIAVAGYFVEKYEDPLKSV